MMRGSASAPQRATHWADLGEHTFVFGIRVLFWVYRTLGALPFRLCLYPVITYYWATRKAARHASQDYLRAVHSHSGALGSTPTWRHTFAHFLAFGDAILDKLLAVSGADPAGGVDVSNDAGLPDALRSGRGAVIVTGHIGCIELCRSVGERQDGVRLNVLVHTAHAEQFNRLLHRLNPDSRVQLIQVTEVNPATAIMLAEKVECGEVIAIAGDRVPVGGGGAVPANFLGATAMWPMGPYVLAALLKCPLYAMVCVRPRGQRGYRLITTCLAERVTLSRKDRVGSAQVHAQRFASWLETVLHDAPLAWFNFFPFWQQGMPPGQPHEH